MATSSEWRRDERQQRRLRHTELFRGMRLRLLSYSLFACGETVYGPPKHTHPPPFFQQAADEFFIILFYNFDDNDDDCGGGGGDDG